MAVSVDNVIRITTRLADVTGANAVMNVFHYRISAGELPETQPTFDAMKAQFWSTCFTSFINNLPTTEELRMIQVQKIAPTLGLLWEYPYGAGDTTGALALDVNEDDPAFTAVCFTMKSFRPGRKGIGRKFFGPAMSRFWDNQGIIKPNPLGGGDLNDVKTALFAPITYTVSSTSQTMRPCICAGNGAGVTSQDDVRAITWAQYYSKLRTRVPGRGI